MDKAVEIARKAGLMEPPGQPEILKRGAGWEYRYQGGVRFVLGRVSESKSSGIRAEVMVFRGDRRLEWDVSLNLGSSRTRAEFAKRLASALPNPGFDWTSALGQVCDHAIAAHRDGEPFVDLWETEYRRPPGYLVYPILPAGQATILYGDGGTSKSALALWLALSSAAGLPMEPPLEARSAPVVLYLDWEEDPEEQRSRLERLWVGIQARALEQNTPVPDAPAIYYRRMYRPLASEIDRITSWCDQSGVTLTVLDSISNAAGGKLIDEDVAIATMSAVREIPGTKLAIAHVSAEAARRDNGGGARPFGSAYWWNHARSAWEMRGESYQAGQRDVSLYHRKMNRDALYQGGLGFRLTYEPDSGPMMVEPRKVVDPGYLPLVDQIADVLKSGALSIEQIAEEIDGKPRSITTALRRNRSRFVLVSGGQGKTGGSVWGLLSDDLSLLRDKPAG